MCQLSSYLMVKKGLGHLQFLHQVRKVASWRDLSDRLLRKYEINPNWFHLGKYSPHMVVLLDYPC